MRSITRIFAVIVLLATSGVSIAKSHPSVTVNFSEIVDRHLSGFHAVDVAGSFDVYITQGSTESVKVEAPSDIISRIITEVDGGVLKIYNKHDTFNWGDLWGHHKKIVVYVVAKNLNSISLTGSGDAFFKEGISSNALRLSISGSGDMTGRVDAKNLDCSITGSGDMKLSGRAETSGVSLVGSGDFTARNLLTVNCAVRVSGSGDAQVNVSERIDASVSGSGDIRYTGSAKVVNSRKSGSGDISRF
ncbi:head GIN domain-containing protein [Mucilaginibacter gotjawali]|uniref:Putative auto-transporter adhesin head GIN domain-containing protein n=1 Tax=Mucilaginibacter gotjawali TaxID=1550579 RepID=A0A839SC66_9SPHI|nr:head GIN domain-containing protein [Mucilaginibacter gotjawali]MBB3054902.1 hypothetical protein [Mucilaginibacter gotjawali]